jgi:hypothetical protein
LKPEVIYRNPKAQGNSDGPSLYPGTIHKYYWRATQRTVWEESLRL